MQYSLEMIGRKSRWEKTKTELNQVGVDVVFLPHTDGICSTELRSVADKKIEE